MSTVLQTPLQGFFRSVTRDFRLVAAAACAVACGAPALSSPPELGPLMLFQGDDAIGLAVDDQQRLSITRGGGGYLVVWEDERAVLSGETNTAYEPLMGNQLDIYGMRLDAQGNPLDPKPIVICSLGRNQTRPRAAWNGTNWLVVFQSQQPDWYFYENILGVRVSPQGQVLDPQPFVIYQQTSNWGGAVPSASSDGVNYLVMWETVVELPTPTAAVVAVRVSPAGTILDPTPVVLRTSEVFGIHHPVAAFDGSKYMIAWSHGLGNIEFRRYQTNLTPIDPAPRALTTAKQGPEIATNGNQFMIAADDAFRIANDGTILDPSGLNVFPGGEYQETMPYVAWTGTHWAFTYASVDGFFDYNARMVRILPNGQVLDPTPITISERSDSHEWSVTVAGDGAGNAQVAYVNRGSDIFRAADVMTSTVSSDGLVEPSAPLSTGLPRQSRIQFADGAPDQHLAVYQSEVGGLTRLLAQRLNLAGSPIDLEPIMIADGDEGFDIAPKVSFNGSLYLIIWDDGAGNVVGRRLSTQGVILDQGPILIASGRSAGAVAAAGDVFVVGVLEYVGFHEPLQYPEFVRVRGSDGVVLDAQSIFLSGGFARRMNADTIGNRAMLVWEQWGRHDGSVASTQGVILDASGPVSGILRISSQLGEQPAVSGSADRAFVAYSDNTNYLQNDLKGRIVMADGSMPFSEAVLSNAPNMQAFPAVGWDGTSFIAAWTDYRTNQGIEQLRGDIWGARVDPTGAVLDPNGFQLTSGVLPEDLPGIAAANGLSIVAFSMLHGADSPEVPRLFYRTVGESAGSPLLTITGNCPGAMNLSLSNATPGGNVAILHANGQGSVRIPNGNPCAGTMLGLNASAQLFRTVRADANGRISINLNVPSNACGRFVQALDAAACRTSNTDQL